MGSATSATGVDGALGLALGAGTVGAFFADETGAAAGLTIFFVGIQKPQSVDKEISSGVGQRVLEPRGQKRSTAQESYFLDGQVRMGEHLGCSPCGKVAGVNCVNDWPGPEVLLSRLPKQLGIIASVSIITRLLLDWIEPQARVSGACAAGLL
jgi:hypothetical protein